MYKALLEIERLLVLSPPETNMEKRIYSIACAALNLADGEAIRQADARAAIAAAIAAAEPAEAEAAE